MNLKNTFILCVFISSFLFTRESASEKTATNTQDSFDIRHPLKSSPLSAYKENYMIFGDDDDQVKVQFSAKFNIFHRLKIGFYLGFTQVFFWDLYEKSNPITEINFNPEFFWRFESGDNFAKDFKIPFIDYIQVGFWEHKSNGKEGELSRGFDRIYIQTQARFGRKVRFGIDLKYFYLLQIDTFKNAVNDNSDIQDYIGSFECKPFLQIWDEKNYTGQEEIYVRFGAGGGPNGFDFKKGWQEYGIKSRAFFSRIRIYAQLFRGYGEKLVDYDKKPKDSLFKETAVRVGLILQ